MEADRFRYLVKRGTIIADAKPSEMAGSANKFTAIEALKAALINWCDHMGMTLEAGEDMVRLAFNQDVFKLLVNGNPDYYMVMQGKISIGTFPNVQMLPGGVEFGLEKGFVDKEKVFLFNLFNNEVVLSIPNEFKTPLITGCTVSIHNVTSLFIFFMKRLNISIEKDLQIEQQN